MAETEREKARDRLFEAANGNIQGVGGGSATANRGLTWTEEALWIAYPPAPEETWSSSTATDATGRPALVGVQVSEGALSDGCCSDRANAILVVDGPGTYLVALGRVPGFKTPEPLMAVVGDQRAAVNFELELAPGR